MVLKGSDFDCCFFGFDSSVTVYEFVWDWFCLMVDFVFPVLIVSWTDSCTVMKLRVWWVC